jgi:hypothetical protein
LPSLKQPVESSSSSWSKQIAERYRCELTPDLADWFDSEIWQETLSGEFFRPVPPRVLLQSDPEVIWPGLMVPDLIPLIGNESGDWLCVRLTEANQTGQIVYWYHGGGDWLPWGKSLAEAILFNRFARSTYRCPDSSLDAGDLSERDRRSGDAASPRDDRVLRWAAEHHGVKLELLPSPKLPEEISINRLLDLDIAEVAVRFLKVQKLLRHWSRDQIVATLEDGLEDRSHRITRCLFDLDLIPESQLVRLVELTGDRRVQRWSAVARHAEVVTRLAPEQAWAWQLLGYEAEKRGSVQEAIVCYERASQCSSFTDHTTALGFHWTEPLASKFSVARLVKLRPAAETEMAYFRALTMPDVVARSEKLMEFWISLSQHFYAADQFADATRCLYAAGWDVAHRSISDYKRVLVLIGDSATRCEQHARAEVVATHLRCLASRYE